MAFIGCYKSVITLLVGALVLWMNGFTSSFSSILFQQNMLIYQSTIDKDIYESASVADFTQLAVNLRGLAHF